jgi:hypothetical protein
MHFFLNIVFLPENYFYYKIFVTKSKNKACKGSL